MHVNEILVQRYADSKMVKIFSPENRYGRWRLVWLTLAEAQLELGFPIDAKKLEKCRETASKIDFERVKEIESEVRHDVMAHLKYWAEICPEVNTTIHIGATSCYVTDNAECLLNKEAIVFVIQKLKKLCKTLAEFAHNTADIAVLGYTHFQPASPTTIGKRVATWIQDLIDDYNELVRFHDSMPCRGVKGTTGTQSSYVELTDDYTKVRRLDRSVARKLQFSHPIELSGQTISRKQDVKIANLLSNIAITLSKMGNDIRLLSHTGDLREGFKNSQIGSSAMPYKRNPMLAERLCALSRLIPQYRNMIDQVAMTQWLERSLDDSATRRVAIPDMFLAIDSALNTAIRLTNSLEYEYKQIRPAEKIFLASELLLARAVKKGFNRQEAHEKLKQYSLKARNASDPVLCFLEDLNNDEIWNNDDLVQHLENIELSDLTGLASFQTIKFLEKYQELLK